MKNHIQKGETINAVNGTGGALSAGDTMLIGAAMVGIAINDIANGDAGEFAVEGVFQVTKSELASSGGAAGDIAYWHNTNGNWTADATGALEAGRFWETVADGTALAKVKINAR